MLGWAQWEEQREGRTSSWSRALTAAGSPATQTRNFSFYCWPFMVSRCQQENRLDRFTLKHRLENSKDVSAP